MSLSSWVRSLTGDFQFNRGSHFRWLRPSASRPCGPRLSLERLEDRLLPSTYTARNVSDLIADINDANKHGGSNTIILGANTTFVLTAGNNTTDGATGLPLIKKGTLTILGNGNSIERSTVAGTPAFRLFDVASGGALMLENLTLQNGMALGSGSASKGGAVYNQGSLVLDGVNVQNNIALGSDGANGTKGNPDGGDGGDAAGGGIWSSGALTLQNGSRVLNNQAIGGAGGLALYDPKHGGAGNGGVGGSGSGGGVYLAGGSALLNNVILSGNSALGGQGGYGQPWGGQGGSGFGGGLFVAAGSVSLQSATVELNTAQGGDGGIYGGFAGYGYGGGLYFASAATAFLDTSTKITTNTADIDSDIHGLYMIQN